MQKNRRPSKRVRSALAQAVKKYGITFMGELLGCTRTLVLSLISGEHNPTERSVRIISRWYLRRKNDRNAYRIWRQCQKGLKRITSVKRDIEWLSEQDILKGTSPDHWGAILFEIGKARKNVRSHMYDELYTLKQK